jgi:hypothetical protein
LIDHFWAAKIVSIQLLSDNLNLFQGQF